MQERWRFHHQNHGLRGAGRPASEEITAKTLSRFFAKLGDHAKLPEQNLEHYYQLPVSG